MKHAAALSSRARLALAAAAVALTACTPQQQPTDPRVEAFAKLPNWSGIWLADGLEPGIDGFSMSRPPAFLAEAPGIPWNAGTMAKLQAELARNPGLQVEPAEGWGYPLMMDGAPPLQFVITPEETLIFNTYRDLRHVYTDGRPHPPEEDRWPTTWGSSVGHWEGDTLVIDTISVREPNKYFGVSAWLSADAHYTERLRMVAPDRIEGEMTIVDPATLSQPWVVKLQYNRAAGWDRLIHDSYDNDRTGFDGDFYTIEPSADPAPAQ
jgi:hypothetical protein